MKDATVIFDLDGTMIDTAPDLIAATNHVLGRIGLAAVEEHIIQPAVAIGAKAMIQAAMTQRGQATDPDMLSAMTQQFIEFYGENIAVRSRVFPGFRDALAQLRHEGARLGVCTNKRHSLTLRLLAELGLDRSFDAIAGADYLPVRKPDAGHLLGTIALAGGDPARAVMIGDSATDAAAARNANVPFVAVSFGYHDGPVEGLKPDVAIDSFEELVPALRRIFPGAKGPVPGARSTA
jgi:phosphoglycolate phosphatase